MLKVLLCGYVTGLFSSQCLARELEEDGALQVLRAESFPNHRAICGCRRHVANFKRLFVEVVWLAATQVAKARLEARACEVDDARGRVA